MNQRAQGFYYEIQNQTTVDSIRYFKNIIDAVDYSLKSDEYDRKPNKKGVVKLRHDKENKKRLTTLRPQLIDAGLYLTAHNYRQDGINAWKLYLKASSCPLLADDKASDETSLAAFYIAQAELFMRNYKAADEYADIALKDDDIAQDAAEIKAKCMHDQMATHEDSVKYLAVLRELYRTEPSNQTYFAWLMQFYKRKNVKFDIEKFVDEELRRNPTSAVPWLLKGEVATHAKRWEEAADAYKHADKIDPDETPILYNIGVSLMNWGIDYGNNSDDDAKKKKEKTEQLFTESQQYLEKTKEKDPRREKVDWVTPLYNIYIMKGENTKAEELKPLVK